MKLFEEYIKDGTIKKGSPDLQRAGSLELEAERKLSSLIEKIEKISVKEDNANDYLEYCYDIILFLIRSKLYKKGYASSGHGAHEAEVSFLKELGFNNNDINFVDQLRYFRNRILYYGKRFDKEYALKVIEFTKKIYPKIKK
jgi:hypothetical protein